MAVTPTEVSEAFARVALETTVPAANLKLGTELAPLFNAGGGGTGGAVDQVAASLPIVVAPVTGIGVVTVSHAVSGVVAATYGDATHFPIVTLDAYGHVTTVSVQAISAAPVPATVAPLALGVAAVGTSLLYARQDHVHPIPTASQVGAEPAIAGGLSSQVWLGTKTWAQIADAQVSASAAIAWSKISKSGAFPGDVGAAPAFTSAAAALFWATPAAASDVPSLRSIVATDLPATITSNTTGSAATLTTGRTIGATGDATGTSAAFNGSAAVSIPLTLATVNSNVGSFGGGASAVVLTVNAKGLVTAVTTAVITPASIGAASASDLSGYLPLTAGASKALTGDLYGTRAIFTTTTDAPISIAHNLAGGFTHPFQAFNSGMVAGNQYNFDFGQNASTNNAANFGFKYVGAGSLSNYVTLGMYGANDLLTAAADGTTRFSGGRWSTSLGGPMLHASGVATPSSANFALAWAADGSGAQLNGTSTALLSVGGVPIVTASSTGAIVNGSLQVGGLSTGFVHAGSTGILSSSALLASEVPALDASKITTGALPDARIASAATWNAKVGGSGTVNTIPMWTASSTLGNSVLTYSTGYKGITNTRATFPAYTLTETSEGVDGKNWGLRSTSGVFAIWAIDDAATGGSNAIEITRSGSVPANMYIHPPLTLLSLGTGITKSTSGLLGIASAGDFPILNQSTTGNAATATLAANSSALGGVGSDYFVQGNGAGPYGHRTTNVTSFNTLLPSGFYDNINGISPLTTSWTHMIRSSHTDPSSTSTTWSFDIAANFYTSTSGNEGYYVRVNEGSNWGTWRTLWHSGNLTNLNQLTNGPGYVTNATVANVDITEHNINNVNYPVVWDNGARSLFHTAAKMWFNPNSGLLAATAIASGSTLSWGGGAWRDLVSNTSYTAAYASGVTPSGANYSLALKKDGAESWLNGSTSSNLAVGSAPIVTATASGAAVTGSLSISALTGATTRLATINAAGQIGATTWANDGPYLPLAGGTVTGPTTFSGTYLQVTNQISMAGSASIHFSGFTLQESSISAHTATTFTGNPGFLFDGTTSLTMGAPLVVKGTGYNGSLSFDADAKFYPKRIHITATTYTLPVVAVGETILLTFDVSACQMSTNSTQSVMWRAAGGTNSFAAASTTNFDSFGYGTGTRIASAWLTGITSTRVDIRG